MGSGAVYDLVLATLRGASISARQRDRALATPVAKWRRILGFDGCMLQFYRAVDGGAASGHLPPALRPVLRDARNTSLQHALLVHRQLADVASVAASAGIRFLALKGAARLLAGELPGARSLGDIDLLVPVGDAARLHQLLQQHLGYVSDGRAYSHHLAGLVRGGSLGIELHVRLAPTPLALDRDIWSDTRTIALGGFAIEIPSPTNLLLHTVEHAVRVNWTSRYRLRDILDVAALFATDVDRSRVAAYVAGSDCRAPMRTLVDAARSLTVDAAPEGRHAWRVVRRVGRARLALATLPATGRVAERWFRYVGVAAEGSPRTLGQLAVDVAGRLSGAVAALALAVTMIVGGTACGDAAAPRPLVVSPFVFAASSAGHWSLYRFRDGVVTQLSSAGSDDRAPNVAAGRIVFSSLRDGNAEIYGAPLAADLTLGAQTRLTADASTDAEPALSPSGATIAFVSGRSGTPRVWLMDGTGANPRILDTGSPDYVPEDEPRWSPTGDRIAFTSSRSGTSQVYVVAAGGGTVTQVSHETRGAYTPAWLPNGSSVLFMAVSGAPRVLSAPASGGGATVFATDTAGLGEPACTPRLCLAVADPLGSAGRIVALTADGQPTKVVIPRIADDHNPAFVLP